MDVRQGYSVIYQTRFGVQCAFPIVYKRRFRNVPRFQSAIIHEIGSCGSAVEPDCRPGSLRAGCHRNRQGAAAKYIRPTGVKTVINCRGTWTFLSGSLEFPEVRQAQVEAAQHFVNVMELQRGVGRRLAELTGAESGIITSGAAGAMAVSAAACMAGADDKHVWQLPDTTGLKHEVIMVGEAVLLTAPSG